jgi:hypothetical protein
MGLRKNRQIVVLLCVMVLLIGHANQSIGQIVRDTLVEYTPDFEFSEGVYLNFDMVKNNDPIAKASIIAPFGYDDRDFFEKVLEKKEVMFYDEFGTKQTIKSNQIWGFSKNGTLYINYNGNFSRIPVVGSITFFVAQLTTYNSAYDPYYYDPYGYPRYGSYSSAQSSTELRQYILDWESGTVYEFDEKSIEILLIKDPELHDEYMQLRKRKKRQLKFYYLRKFNERNKLLIPKNELL